MVYGVAMLVIIRRVHRDTNKTVTLMEVTLIVAGNFHNMASDRQSVRSHVRISLQAQCEMMENHNNLATPIPVSL